ncbi:alpha/beta fold hydrolase, partial [Streptomyces sp. NPDC003233]
VAGGASPEWMREASREISRTVPEAAYRELAGQTHMVEPDVLGPVLAEFFAG